MTSTGTSAGQRARYGAAALEGVVGKLPVPFPRTMGPNAMRYLQEVVDSGLRADVVTRFERRFAAEMGVKHCIATPGCTPALQLLAMALPFQPGDEVIVSPISDYGTIMGLIKEQYIPVFADVAPGTPNVSAETIAPLITDRTRAILAVHKTGLLCDMDPIVALARKHDLVVIEDVCQAVFGRYKGRLAGTLGDAAGFSFDAEKTMGSDVGGCLVTDDDALAERARFLGHSRGAQQDPGFGRRHTEAGAALRMPQGTAAITLAQLEIIHEQVAQRDRMARLLYDLLAEIPGITPPPIPSHVTVFSPWMVGFSVDPQAFRCTPDEFGRQCAAAGIPGISTARYYLLPEACTFLKERAAARVYPYSSPPASRAYTYGAEVCPTAQSFLETFLRWSTFCEKYQPEHCELAASIVRQVADANRA
ncbi:MAG TPA: DegT/DnrJ/EryC1/StrS family aminotransferase [Chloroflexota bacterium]|jgi:perosamine synthetase|nr:DegT/DnrJ/EryC1/StrS family aminotransferase [Chloroflexota bacterium]